MITSLYWVIYCLPGFPLSGLLCFSLLWWHKKTISSGYTGKDFICYVVCLDILAIQADVSHLCFLSKQKEKKNEYTVSGIKWNASFKLRNKWNVESLNSLNGIQSSNLCCWVACRGTVVVLFSFFARACWVQQIGVNWLEFTLEEPQGYTVISTQREKPE